MNKALTTFLAAGAVAAAALAAPAPAQAHRHGGAVAAGVAGGFIAGAIIGSAVAPAYAYPAYAPAPGYVVYSGYGAAYPVACPGGYWARRPLSFDRAGRPVSWSRARFICP